MSTLYTMLTCIDLRHALKPIPWSAHHVFQPLGIARPRGTEELGRHMTLVVDAGRVRAPSVRVDRGPSESVPQMSPTWRPFSSRPSESNSLRPSLEADLNDATITGCTTGGRTRPAVRRSAPRASRAAPEGSERSGSVVPKGWRHLRVRKSCSNNNNDDDDDNNNNNQHIQYMTCLIIEL